MAMISVGRRENFDILQEGLFDFLVDDKLDLIKRQAASIMKLYDVARYDYSYSSGYFHLCTAFGKSYLIKAIAEAYNSKKSGKKIIVLEENRAVVEQMARELTVNSSLKKTDIGMFYSERKDVDTPIIVCTYASMKKMINQVGRENIGLVLCDEAHHILSENRQNVAKEFADCALYGFTATSDYGEQDKNCATVFGPVIDSVTIREGIERDGLLCSTKTGLFLSNIPVDLTRAIAQGHEDYDPNILDELLRASHVDGLRRGLADWYLNGTDETIGNIFGKATIINVPSIAEADRVAKEFNSAAAARGMQPIARAYHTRSGDWILDDFNAGKFPVLIQVNKLTEGYNNPNVTICINYPTHSIVRSVQCSGRALRFNPNDPNKCALVMDVAFARRSADVGEKDVLSRIYENGQRLFYDVLGTVQCLNPYDKRSLGKDTPVAKPRPRENIELPSVFRVVTSVEFTNMIIEHQINNPNIDIKTDEWLSALDLAKDRDFPSGKIERIRNALINLQYDPEFEGYIKDMRSGTQTVKCLHISKKQAFADRAGFKPYPIKTDEWLSAGDLVKDNDFPRGNIPDINMALSRLQHDPEFEGDILDMKASGNICKCLRATRKQAFALRAGFKPYPVKTGEWLSAYDLVNDKDFPNSTWSVINAKLLKLEHEPEFEGYIKDMKTGTRPAKCIHVSKKQTFADRAGFLTFPVKTSEWLSTGDLARDSNFPNPNVIRDALVKLEHDPEFEGYIKDMKINGVVGKCIHISKKQAFADRVGAKSYPVKTDEWLSCNNLFEDEDFPSANYQNINNALIKLEHDPEFEGYIKDMKIKGVVAKCLHISKKQAFADRAGFKQYPKKTDEWLSVNELAKDKDFPSNTWENIILALTKFEHDPEFEGYIKDMKNGPRVAKCLHVSKKQAFADRAGFKAYPKKTAEWLSARDLVNDDSFPRNNVQDINTALIALEHDPEFEGYIKDMKTGSRPAKCIHVSKKQAFADRARFKAYPLKTDEWLSANDLMKDKDFPSSDHTRIKKALIDLQYDPEFEGYIQDMQIKGVVTKCIHISKKEILSKIFKKENLLQGTKAVRTLDAVNTIKENIKPDDQHQI